MYGLSPCVGVDVDIGRHPPNGIVSLKKRHACARGQPADTWRRGCSHSKLQRQRHRTTAVV